MLTAQPSVYWKKLASWYFMRSLRKAFYRCHIRGQEHILPWKMDSDPQQKLPLLLYCSHGGWWDAAITIVLSIRTLQLDGYGMMEEKQLERYQFFRKIGMFSVHRQNSRSALQSLRYAEQLLKGTNRALWIFPQGELVHQESRPLHLYSGLAVLMRMLGTAMAAPVAIRYEFLKEQKPECFISIGRPHLINIQEFTATEQITELCSRELTNSMDALRNDILQDNLQDFTLMMQGGMSMEKKWDKVRGIR
jgi:1-acyl-sn-glycerol-3-phosphate acyltransferase